MLATKNNIYQQYTYGYPHKHAYRFFKNPIELKKAWLEEDKSNLFAYLHIPYCEMRCGFCNLFTIANPKNGVGEYLNALQREANEYRNSFDEFQFEEYAIGGGTPTYLSVAELEKMLSIFKNDLGVDMELKYGSIEASPKSISQEKIALIEHYGINRISMGIQSWIESETKLLGRPQVLKEVTKAVEHIKLSKVPEVNLDLIYGIQNQTKASWLYSLEKTISYEPTEIFLYPLYNRPLTGLSKMQNKGEDNRLELFRIGRDFLKRNGYTQKSMRCFRKNDAFRISSNYNARTHGMIGIGAGARSYTRDLHYSTNYAVTRKAIQAIIHDYSIKQDFSKIIYGVHLNEEERLRRFLIKSIIDGGRLNPRGLKKQYGKDVSEIEVLEYLIHQKLLIQKDGFFQLSEKGMELEDMIGPMFFTKEVKNRMQAFELA